MLGDMDWKVKPFDVLDDFEVFDEFFNASASWSSRSAMRFSSRSMVFACASTILRKFAIMSSLLAIYEP